MIKITYTCPTLKEWRLQRGTLAEKIYQELYDISAEISANNSKFVDLTASMVSSTSLAANGADLADGTNPTFYAVFTPPVPITVVKMYTYITESYAKDTIDAVIAVATEADAPVTIFTRTLTAGGEAARSFASKTPETGTADIDAGTGLNLVITSTASGTGTGHAKVWLEYIER